MEKLTRQIKVLALKNGFQLVGIVPARQPAKSKYLDEWLARGYHGCMHYMQSKQAERKNIQLLFPEARSVICLGHNYFSSAGRFIEEEQARISCYAWGKDYHSVVKNRLKILFAEIKRLEPRIKGRCCVDSAPLMEKLWAETAGLGWQGKHTILISRHLGSWFFLGEIIVNIDLAYDNPVQDYCGNCEACLSACPTAAIVEPYVLDASRCLSYLTVEYKADHLPGLLSAAMDKWIFGCDICQQVCPWNKFGKMTAESDYWPVDPLKGAKLIRLLNMKEEDFKTIFRNSPVKRIGFKNFRRNVQNAVAHLRRE
jgi:epoxyqueuosine reductase